MFEEIKKLVPEIVSNSTNPYSRKIGRIIQAIELVENFDLETDKITATEYKNLKETLNGLNFTGFNTYLDGLEDFKNYAEIFNRYPQLNAIFYEVPDELYRITPNKISKFKKMKNLSPFEKGAVDYVVKRLEMFLPLAEKVAAMKECVGKKVVETKKQKVAREAQQIRGKLDDKLKRILEEIAEFFRKKIEKSRIDYYTRKIENYDKTRIKRYSEIEDIEYFVTYPGYDLKPNALEMISDKAKSDSEEIIQDFIYKMLVKLGGLVVNFPNLKVSYDGTTYRNWIHFRLSDDTYFSIENNIVTGVSKYGVWFNRYPTTFHNVVINGEKVATPSELKVKKLLNEKSPN